MSSRILESKRSHGNIFHQRKPSLTTVCPPTDTRSSPRRNSAGTIRLSTSSSKKSWMKKLFDMPMIQLVGWTYVVICFCLSTLHLIRSFALLDSSSNKVTSPKINWDKVLMSRQEETLNDVLIETRLSKMFSKSVVNNDYIRPYWFTASIKPSKDALSLNTVVTLSEWDYLTRLAELYEGPISASLLVPSTVDIHDPSVIKQLNMIRHNYETTVALRRYVDIHLILQPGAFTEDYNATTSSSGGYQEGRNLARLFSKTEFIALVPVKILWMTEIFKSFQKYIPLLRQGDLLVVPTFGFPNYDGVDTDFWPTDKLSMIESVEEGQMGLLDYHYELNNGPTSFQTWRDAKDPYLVPHYDFNYGPIFISTRLHHPWCDERFEDHLASCVYTKYLNGANLWVMPNDYAIRTGLETANSLITPQQRKSQSKIANRYRIEQCVFYARQLDQYGMFESEIANHVKQECSIALLSLQKQKMISDILE